MTVEKCTGNRLGSHTLLRIFGGFGGILLAVALVWGILYVLGLKLGKGAGSPRISGRPVNFAHRGDSSSAPENTLESFRLGTQAGAGGLEMDVHLTSDGYTVVIHDATIDRTTDGSGSVADMTLEDLERWDAGYRFTLDGRAFPYRGIGAKISTLARVYEEFPEACVNVEIKSDSPEAPERMLEVIVRAGAEERTVVAASDHGTMKRFRKAAGGRIATSASVREIYLFYFASRFGLENVLRIPYVALQVPARTQRCEVVTTRFVAAAKSRGVAVDVWTINDEREMHRLLDLGVDVIMTDRPGVLDVVLRKRSGG